MPLFTASLQLLLDVVQLCGCSPCKGRRSLNLCQKPVKPCVPTLLAGFHRNSHSPLISLAHGIDGRPLCCNA
eukprot:1230907-Amphidinium_carterae.1